MFINSAISQQPLPFLAEYDWLLFVGLIVLALSVSQRFQIYMIRLTNNILFEFELSILEKLRYASFGDFQKLGTEKVYTAINDARVLGNVPQLFVNSFNSLIMVICCLAYMFWVSPAGGVSVLVVMGMLLVIYMIRNKKAEKDLNLLRDLQNDYYRYLKDLLMGFKEVKMSTFRNNNIFKKFLVKNRNESKGISESTSISYMNNELTGSYSWYILLGVIIFALPRFFGLDIGQTSAFIVTILYMIGPVAGLITFLPLVTKVKIALNRLEEYDKLLQYDLQSQLLLQNQETFDEEFSRIEFRDVTYEYHDKEKQKTFVFGPINVSLHKGERIFITGGNGSGKTTFVKLLTGLYKPLSGQIYLNDTLITEQNYASYRDQISTVFADNHIFRENYDEFNLNSDNAELTSYFDLMKLKEKVDIEDGEYQITGSLSQGQRKRMAMILALLESRSLLVLDEWAAEQDPQFRYYFYQKILDYLKNSDKTVVAITHDDAYFHLADRIIKFDFGKIASDASVLDKEISLQELFE